MLFVVAEGATDGTRDAGLTDDQINAEKSALATQLRNFTAGNQNYLAKPAERFCRVAPWSAATFDPDKFVPMLQWYDHAQARMFMAQVLDLGTQASGSRAVATEHTQAAVRFGVNALEWMREAMQPCVERLLSWNFGDLSPENTPRLTFSGLRAEAFVEFLSEMPALVAAGLVQPSADVVAATHRGTGLPAPDADAVPSPSRVRRRARDILREGE